jgi:hypothetical protein
VGAIDGQTITPGQVGTSSNRSKIFADEIDANSVNGALQACRVVLSSDQSLTAGIISAVQYDNVVFDSDNNFDSSTHSWTCPEDGLYTVNTQVTFNAGGSGDERQVEIGTGSGVGSSGEGAFVRQKNSDTGDSFQASTVNRYQSGDTIAAFARNTDSDDSVRSGKKSFQSFLEVAFLGGL